MIGDKTLTKHLNTLFKDVGIDTNSITLADCLDTWIPQYASKIAIINGDEKITYSELNCRIEIFTDHLRNSGFHKGDRVIVQLPNSINFVVTCFAFFRLGVIPVLAMPTQGEYDIDSLCEIAKPVAYCISADDDSGELAMQISKKHASILHIIIDCIIADTECSFRTSENEENYPLEATVIGTNDVALLLLSGGTTGTPKLIPRTHYDYIYNFLKSSEMSGIDKNTVYLAILPIAHNFALGCPGILGVLASGGTVIFSDTASPDEAMPLIEQEKVTHIALVPPLAKIWVQAREWEDSDLTSLKVVQVGGSRTEAILAKEIKDSLGGQVQQVFGMAEGLICCTRLEDPDDIIFNTQGRPMSSFDEIRIVNENEDDVLEGEIGQLLTCGPYTIKNYYGAKEQNRASFTDNGFYRTGDLVRKDKMGNLVVVGRIKEQIHRGGEKISVAEIETLINTHSFVDMVVVVGVPDSILGERICAFVQINCAIENTNIIKESLRKSGLSEFKLPDQIKIISRWPLTNVGKIDKQELIKIAQKKDNKHLNIEIYKERTLSIMNTPLELMSKIASEFSEENYLVYECEDEWSIGLGSVMDIIVKPNGDVWRSDGLLWDDVPTQEALTNAMTDIPFNKWRAYGWADFELSYVFKNMNIPLGEKSLLKLSIPRCEVRLTKNSVCIRAFDESELTAMETMIMNFVKSDNFQVGERLDATLELEDTEGYKNKVDSAVKEINAQKYKKVILSRKVEVQNCVDMVSSYFMGRQENTPARSFLLKDDDFESYGFNPETVMEVDQNRWVSTQPLAGTRALLSNEKEDVKIENELMSDEKEIAEHAISVKYAMLEMSEFCDKDTLKINDFMSICRRGSVRHLASKVTGKLSSTKTIWDAFMVLFPAITASGIPKVEALDSIHRFEKRTRGLYSGSVIVADSDGVFDAGLVLRSAYKNKKSCWLQAGAGIMSSSTSDREWTETCEKLASVSRHLYKKGKK